MTHYWQKRNCW